MENRVAVSGFGVVFVQGEARPPKVLDPGQEDMWVQGVERFDAMGDDTQSCPYYVL